MAELKNELSWSISRDRIFKDCRRAYYYQYYQAWGGWNDDAPEDARKAYILKNVRSIDIWIGDIIHQIIAWVMREKKQGTHIEFKRASEQTLKMLKRTWTQSSHQWWKNNVKANLNLFEHYYNVSPPQEELRMKMEKAARCIRNFYGSGLPESISAEQLVSIDEFDAFILNGVKVFAIPDLVVNNGRYVLYDWKTGQRSVKDVMQLSLYLLYAKHKWGVESEKIDIVPVYLNENDLNLEPVEASDGAEVIEYMLGSNQEMKEVLSDVENNTADIAECPKTTETFRCQNCKFKEICS